MAQPTLQSVKRTPRAPPAPVPYLDRALGLFSSSRLVSPPISLRRFFSFPTLCSFVFSTLMSMAKYSNRASLAMLPKTPLFRWLALLLLVIVVYFYHPSFTGYSIEHASTLSGGNLDDLSYVKSVLKLHKIGPEIEYASRTIRYLPDAAERKSITRVPQYLFPQSFTNITIDRQKSLPAARLLDVHVHLSPRPDQVEAGGMIFGVSTTYDRFADPNHGPIEEWKRWLTDGNGNTNNAHLVLALFNTSDENIALAAEKLAKAGINATVQPSNLTLDMPGRYVDLVQMMYNHPTASRRQWFVLVDDDTFFPYPHELQRTLSQFDTSKPYYIGTFTERMDWMLNNHAPFAYGGGGVFLSAPTAERLTNLPCLQKNEDGSYFLTADQGDRLLYNCLRHHTEITLTYLPQLHQQDHFGDLSGFYESGEQPLSLHHYKSWHSFAPAPTHLVSDACGEDCVFQRFQFEDNYIITNGYSVAHYPQGINFDPEQVEHTFGAGEDENFDFSETVFAYAHGQLRQNLSGTGRKEAWQLLGSRKEGEGRVRQVYFKSRGDKRWRKEEDPEPERDSIVVLTWIP